VRDPRRCHRYLGLELAGAKNNKTTLATLEFYPKERKVFLLDLHDKIAGAEDADTRESRESNDEALLALIRESAEAQEAREAKRSGPGATLLAVNVPLTLPPCIGCERKTCPLPARCTVPEVKWMQGLTRRLARDRSTKTSGFTPYTQRPVELHIRHTVLPEVPQWARFEIDEALGGTKAPLTARMHFLARHLARVRMPVIEAWPKLTIAMLAGELGIDRRTLSHYRQLEQGVHAREVILERIAQRHEVFIYERDVRKMTHSLACFDAFVCAFTALLSDQGRCARPPRGFPAGSGWVSHPIGS